MMVDIEDITDDLDTLRCKANDSASRKALKRCEEMLNLLVNLEATICDPDKYLVYKHTGPNEKIYIGITKNNPSTRWNNGDGYSSQKKFNKAITKYGWINFKHEIIAANLDEESARSLERQSILEYRSSDPRYGYNTVVDSPNNTSADNGSQQTTQPYDAKPTKRKEPESKEKKQSGNKARGVVCLETGQSFESATRAAESVEVTKAAVYTAINNGTTAAGYHWQYRETYEPSVHYETQKRLRPKQPSEIVSQFISEKNAFFIGKHLYISDESGEKSLNPWSNYVEKWLITHGVEANSKRKECIKQLEILADHRTPPKKDTHGTVEKWVQEHAITQYFVTNTARSDLYDKYCSWCESYGTEKLGKKRFYKELRELFLLSEKIQQRHDGKRYFLPS